MKLGYAFGPAAPASRDAIPGSRAAIGIMAPRAVGNGGEAGRSVARMSVRYAICGSAEAIFEVNRR
jgi:hypothetical protein